MKSETVCEIKSCMQQLSWEETACVAGGMINLHSERPRKPPIEPGHPGGGAGYFLPEMEMDTGIIYLP